MRGALLSAFALGLAATGAHAAEGEDVTETIDIGEEPEAEATAGEPTAPPPAPPRWSSGVKTLWRGWIRGAGIAGMRDAGDDHEPAEARLHYDKLVGTQTMFLQLGAVRGDALEAGVSGMLTTSWAVAEAGEDRAELHPSLREAYLGYRRPHSLVRAGQQRVVWGISDAFRPNDVLNARDLRDGTQTENEALEIPTPSVRVDWEPAVGSMVQLVAGPFLPDEFDMTGTNWAVVQRPAPRVLRAIVRAPDAPPLLEEADGPSKVDPRAWTAGWAMKLRPVSADVNVYYHYGYDRTPLTETAPEVQDALAAMSLTGLDPEALAAVAEDVRADGREISTSGYVRRHHVGLDVQTTHGDVVLRQDVSFDTQMVFLKRNLDGVARPALQGVFGLEWQTGQLGKLVLLELHHLQILDPPAEDTLLLQRAANTSVAATLRWKWGNVIADAQLVQGVYPVSTLIRPEVGWKKERLDLRLGVLLLTGQARTYGSYYTESSSAYATAKYMF
jgi:hypothetical protein